MPQISVKTLTGKTVNVNVEPGDDVKRIKAKVMLAEGVLSRELQTATRMMLGGSAMRLVHVATGEEIKDEDEEVVPRLEEGQELKLVVRKLVNELTMSEFQWCDSLFKHAETVVKRGSPVPPVGLDPSITEAEAHLALARPPALTRTLHLEEGFDFKYDIQVAFGVPLIDRSFAPPRLNGRGLVFEAHDRE